MEVASQRRGFAAVAFRRSAADQLIGRHIDPNEHVACECVQRGAVEEAAAADRRATVQLQTEPAPLLAQSSVCLHARLGLSAS